MRMIYIKAIAGFIFAPNPLPKKIFAKGTKKANGESGLSEKAEWPA